MIDESPAAARAAGRVCPLRYRYGAASLREAALRRASALYVVGGLYGNLPALDAVERLAAAEQGGPVTICFNGDFNWFDIDPATFAEINQRVLRHDAILGNVEAELDAAADDAGCGCAYPDSVDQATVERSNRIHRQLKVTAALHPELLRRIVQLPMVARYSVAGLAVGVVHGDAETLAGWRFDVAALDDDANLPWLRSAFSTAAVDLFASSHTCLPALRRIDRPGYPPGCVVNNGAAGMPNFAGDQSGLCTRIGGSPSPHPVVHELRIGDAWVSLLRVAYDVERWRAMFLRQWPAGSPAWCSYFERIEQGTSFTVGQALQAPLRAEFTGAATSAAKHQTQIV